MIRAVVYRSSVEPARVYVRPKVEWFDATAGAVVRFEPVDRGGTRTWYGMMTSAGWLMRFAGSLVLCSSEMNLAAEYRDDVVPHKDWVA
jgi:hypothetical protein